MVLEELTLRYYLKLSSLSAVLLIVFYLIYIVFFNQLFPKEKTIKIYKGDSIRAITEIIFEEKNYFDKKISYFYLIVFNKFISNVKYGKFYIKENTNLYSTINILSKKSNIDYNISIIEGWESYKLDKYLSKFYNDIENIPYVNLIADTYKINSSNTFGDLKKFLVRKKNNFFKNYKNNEILKIYGEKNILIIASLVEKEAQNNEDKKLITSVIFNRLNIDMKLQIDATVIYSLTEGKSKLKRKLSLKDLKTNHKFNTYYIKALPPGMICYVSPKTIEIVLENPKSDYLFYFYNIIEKKHIYSKNFKEHKAKLNDYRKKI